MRLWNKHAKMEMQPNGKRVREKKKGKDNMAVIQRLYNNGDDAFHRRLRTEIAAK